MPSESTEELSPDRFDKTGVDDLLVARDSPDQPNDRVSFRQHAISNENAQCIESECSVCNGHYALGILIADCVLSKCLFGSRSAKYIDAL